MGGFTQPSMQPQQMGVYNQALAQQQLASAGMGQGVGMMAGQAGTQPQAAPAPQTQPAQQPVQQSQIPQQPIFQQPVMSTQQMAYPQSQPQAAPAPQTQPAQQPVQPTQYQQQPQQAYAQPQANNQAVQAGMGAGQQMQQMDYNRQNGGMGLSDKRAKKNIRNAGPTLQMFLDALSNVNTKEK